MTENTTTTTKTAYWLPTRPYSLIDAINRRSLATGSVRSAAAGHTADYNGHRVCFIEPNKFKRYWHCSYTWAGIHTIGRGTLDACLAAAEREYDRGALGADAIVEVTTPEDAATVEARGRWVPYTEESAEAHYRSFADARYDRINEARDLEKWGIVPGAVGLLANSDTVEEFQAELDDYTEKEKARRQANRQAVAR